MALQPVYALHMGPQTLCMFGIWGLTLIYDASGACQHSVGTHWLILALRPVYALHMGPQALCMLDYGSWPLDACL
jgi:hypothetical protein